MTPYKQSQTPILLAVCGLAVLSVIAVLAVTAIRPDVDNTNLITNIMSILLPTTLALLAFLKSTENATSIHAVGKENAIAIDNNKRAIDETSTVAQDSKNLSAGNAEELKEVHSIINGRMDDLIKRTVAAARAEALVEGASAAAVAFRAQLEKAAESEGNVGIIMSKAAPEMPAKAGSEAAAVPKVV